MDNHNEQDSDSPQPLDVRPKGAVLRRSSCFIAGWEKPPHTGGGTSTVGATVNGGGRQRVKDRRKLVAFFRPYWFALSGHANMMPHFASGPHRQEASLAAISAEVIAKGVPIFSGRSDAPSSMMHVVASGDPSYARLHSRCLEGNGRASLCPLVFGTDGPSTPSILLIMASVMCFAFIFGLLLIGADRRRRLVTIFFRGLRHGLIHHCIVNSSAPCLSLQGGFP